MTPGFCRAINEQPTIFGMNRKVFALALVVPAIASACGAAWYLTDLSFPLMVCAGTWMAKRDPKVMEIWAKTWRQPGIYDPMKRSTKSV